MVKKRITKQELTGRTGYVLLGLFAGLFIDSVRDWIEVNTGLSPWMIGIIGFFAILYYFEF